MVYQSTKPQPTDLLSDSQGDIRDNFIQIDTAFKVDHYALNDANQGKHNAIHLPVVAALPFPATAANEIAIYNRANALYMRDPSSGAEMQISGGVTTAGATGSTVLPGGIILKWGSLSFTHPTTTTVTFAVAFPTSCYNVQVTNISSNWAGVFPTVSTLSTTGFQFFARPQIGGTIPFTMTAYYLAIGK